MGKYVCMEVFVAKKQKDGNKFQWRGCLGREGVRNLNYINII